ncbi:hypothetical protein CROQUDRAFT_63769 [Cronartium quercuum f. sp. fusiforme G11]|uniref:ATP-dependent RNA helicase n=1 Tax=Cronartium quercuum f. sp. fusiforme G11 TaxID=708437 RepID=A0A9P6NGE8_9BASI|nr:hypothetical protein CROQUDRAFT_63769 [Cronartium quercuum f. sp. fusiforme G11]
MMMMMIRHPDHQPNGSDRGSDDDSSNSNSIPSSPLSIDDRLGRLESSIASLSACYQRDFDRLKLEFDHHSHQIHSLSIQLTTISQLYKSWLPFNLPSITPSLQPNHSFSFFNSINQSHPLNHNNHHNNNHSTPIPTLSTSNAPLSPITPTSYQQSHLPLASAPPNSLAAKWEQLGITPDLLRAIVRFGIGPPTKTQQKSIPLMLVGKDLVSQSNPIQERIQAYVIPALQLIAHPPSTRNPPSGNYPTPFHLNKPTSTPPPNQTVKVLIITATLDEASQAYRLANGIASLLPNPLKVTHCSSDPQSFPSHPALSQHPQPHILIGTPSKLLDPVNGLRGYTFDASDFICVVLDEMDQLLARNMTDMVSSLMNFLPTNHTPPTERQSPPASSQPPEWSSPPFNGPHRSSLRAVTSPVRSCFNSLPSPPHPAFPSAFQHKPTHARQTCIFSCTVPQDVLTYARTLNLRARVLVRRDEPANATPPHLPPHNSAGSYDLSDLRAQLPNPLPSLSGRTSPQELVKTFRQYYLSIMIGPATSPTRARHSKLDALVGLLEDLERGHELPTAENPQPFVLVYCNSVDSVESVSYKLVSRGIDALALHQDMGPAARHSILTRFNKLPLPAGAPVGQNSLRMKALVVYDVLSKSLVDLQSYESVLPMARQTIVVNFELPRAVEDYVHRAACMIPNHKKSNGSGGLLINLLSVLSDVEMLKSIENFYRCQIKELPHHHLHLL